MIKMDEVIFPSFHELRFNSLYNVNLDQVIKEEFNKLDGITYVDHAATTLYSSIQIASVFDHLNSSIFGNPHSRNVSSDSTSHIIDSTRNRILDYFNTNSDEYDVIFTSGATDAIKLVAECFSWKEILSKSESLSKDKHKNVFIYSQENHTSILGIREVAHNKGVDIHCLKAKELKQFLENSNKSENFKDDKTIECTNVGLFAYPGQCNFSGSKYPLSWIESVHNGKLNFICNQMAINDSNARKEFQSIKWFVLLDAASLVATSALNLTVYKPDFVPISFYKMFGYPTGLGCLLVNKRAKDYMIKSYFGGGTVQVADARSMMLNRRPNLHERFEDGTLAFLTILALDHGFNCLKRITGSIKRIEEHVFNVAYYMYCNLRSMRHANYSPVAEIYSEYDTWTSFTQGSIVNFNIIDSKGNYIGFSHVERVASIYNIHLRTGCVCNPGACQKYLGISSHRLQLQFQAGHVCGDSLDIVDNHPTGSVRVSFGYMSRYEDADHVLSMIKECFVEGHLIMDKSWIKLSTEGTLVNCEESDPKTEEKTLVNCEESDTKTEETKVIKQCFVEGHLIMDRNSIKLSTEGILVNCEESDTKTEENKVTYVKNKYNNIKYASPLGYPIERQRIINTPKHYDFISNDTTPPTIFNNKYKLTEVIIYPVKSCAGISAKSWRIGNRGLEYDRGWMIVTSGGVTLTQKRVPQLILIQPTINHNEKYLELSCKGFKSVKVSLFEEGTNTLTSEMCGGRVCGDKVIGIDCGEEVGTWLSQVLGIKNIKLMRQIKGRKNRFTTAETELSSVSLANESQYLIIHESSVRSLLTQITERGIETTLTENDLKLRFRPNLILTGGEPYEEDQWDSLSVGCLKFKVHGGCTRCQMICVDPDTGQKTREPLLTLATTRGQNMKFGIHASFIQDGLSGYFLHTDMDVSIKKK